MAAGESVGYACMHNAHNGVAVNEAGLTQAADPTHLLTGSSVPKTAPHRFPVAASSTPQGEDPC